LALAAGALPPAAFELYRLISFGSIRAYAAFWRDQVPQIVSQAGFQIEGALDLDRAARQAGRSVFAKIAEHWSVLARDVGMNGVELTVVVVAPFAALVWLAVLHRSTWRTWLVDRQGLLAVQVALYCGGYLVWWLAITPTDKAWYRRIVIGLVALAFLYVLIVGSVTDAVRPALRPPRRWRTSESLLGGFTACAVATAGFAVAPAAADTVTEAFANAPWRANSPAAAREREVREVAREVDRISAEGGKVYAIGWWSVPVVQVYAESPIRNLFGLLREGWDDFCQPTAGLVTGEAYILWDTASARELGFDPREVIDNVTFDPTPRLANGEATILAVSVDPQFCSDILGK
jgi:hypothetical protein